MKRKQKTKNKKQTKVRTPAGSVGRTHEDLTLNRKPQTSTLNP